MAQYSKDTYNIAPGLGRAIADPREDEARAREASARAERALQEEIQASRRTGALQFRQQQNEMSRFLGQMGLERDQMYATQQEAQAARDFQAEQQMQQNQFAAGESELDRYFRGTQAGYDRQFQGQQAGLNRQFQGQQAGLDRQQQVDMANAQLLEQFFGRQQQQSQFETEQAGVQDRFDTQQAGLDRRFDTQLRATQKNQDRGFFAGRQDAKQQQSNWQRTFDQRAQQFAETQDEWKRRMETADYLERRQPAISAATMITSQWSSALRNNNEEEMVAAQAAMDHLIQSQPEFREDLEKLSYGAGMNPVSARGGGFDAPPSAAPSDGYYPGQSRSWGHQTGKELTRWFNRMGHDANKFLDEFDPGLTGFGGRGGF